MSPFLFFSNEKRQEMQKQNVNMKMTEITSLLGQQWRDMTDEQKKPYVEKSKEARDIYHKQQEIFKNKAPQPILPTPQTVVATPITVVAPNQWAMQMGDSTTNPIYARTYDMTNMTNMTNMTSMTSMPNMANMTNMTNMTNLPNMTNSSNSFTNISIPTGFGCKYLEG